MRTQTTAFHALEQTRWHKRLLWAGAAFLVHVLVAFFVRPPIITSQPTCAALSTYAPGDE